MSGLLALKTWLAMLWENARTSFWFVPVLMSVGAGLLAALTLMLDSRLNLDEYSWLSWLYGGGAEGARSMLTMIGSSAITVAGTSFSITIAALSLASSQFGPRLLRTFVRDTGNQIVLGTFIATFLYCLLIVRTVRGSDGDTDAVIPQISVTAAVLLAVASMGVLIYFIHHAAMSIRAEHVIASVSRDLETTLEDLFPAQLGRGMIQQPDQDQGEPSLPTLTGPTRPIMLGRDGYLQMVSTESLIKLASEHDLCIRLYRRPGDFIIAHEPAAYVSPAEQVDDELHDRLARTLIIGGERSMQQDIAFGINQLVEVAARALSPGINDPFTALSCLDRLGAVLCQLGRRPLPDGRRYDEAGQLRIIAEPTRFGDLVDAAFDQIRIYGRANTIVMLRLLETIARVGAATTGAGRHAPLARQARLAYESSVDALPADSDRERLRECMQATLRQLQNAGDLQTWQ